MDTTETDYYINLFKNPAILERGQHDLSKIYSKARTSLKKCMKDLQLSDQFKYIDSHYSGLTNEFFKTKN